MDFLIELLLQFIVQVVVEVIFEALWHGLARAFRTRLGRYALTATVGAGFGIGWGWHLAGEPNPPKLLWVSIVLAVAALLLAERASSPADSSLRDAPPWRQALAPPKKWPPERWLDFAFLNAAIAAGVFSGYAFG